MKKKLNENIAPNNWPMPYAWKIKTDRRLVRSEAIKQCHDLKSFTLAIKSHFWVINSVLAHPLSVVFPFLSVSFISSHHMFYFMKHFIYYLCVFFSWNLKHAYIIFNHFNQGGWDGRSLHFSGHVTIVILMSITFLELSSQSISFLAT